MERRYPNPVVRRGVGGGICPRTGTGPQVLLLDEAFAAIDAKIRTERNWLREMVVKLGITSIFVSDQDEAVEVADEIIITNMDISSRWNADGNL